MAVESPVPTAIKPKPQGKENEGGLLLEYLPNLMSEKQDKLFEALRLFQGQNVKIIFDKTGQFKNGYASLKNILDTVRQPLLEAGIVLSTFFLGPYLVVRIDGPENQWRSSVLPLSAFSSKPGAQGVGGAITYATRYAICSLLAIAADDDNDASDKPVTVRS